MDKDQIIQLRNHHLKQGRNNDRKPIYPITKAECIIGDVGGGIEKVDTLPETGEAGKIYYNTSEKVYYTYTEENGWSELGNGGLKQYVFPYQVTPCFFGARTPVGPTNLDDYVEYDQEHDLFLIKDGVELTVDTNKNVNNAVEALSADYYISMPTNIMLCTNLLLRGNMIGPDSSSVTFSKTIDILDLYSRDLVAHSDDSWNRGRAWEFIIYTVEVNIEYDSLNRAASVSFKILNKKIGSIGEYILPQMNIIYTALRQNGLYRVDAGTKGYITGIKHIGDVLQGYGNGFSVGTSTPPKIANLSTGATYFTDYDTGMSNLKILDSDISQYNIHMFTEIPLFCSLCYRGRFVANVASMNITLPATILPAESNPSTEVGHRYEFSIFDGIFTLADVSTTTN